MHIKRFEGATIQAVLRQVREELGPEALVLSTRSIRRDRGFFGKMSKPVIEVTAATDRKRAVAAPTAATGSTPVARTGPDSSWKELRLTRALMRPLEEEIQSLRGVVDKLAARGTSPLSDELAREIRELRKLAADAAARNALAEPQAERRDPYLRAGLDLRHAASLRANLATTGFVPGADVGSAAVAALARRLDPVLLPPRPEDDSVVLYVGPPGGGKTTTLAKLAARCIEAPEGPVVVSTDAHRLGATASLAAYAKQLGLPFETAVSARSLGESLARFGNRRLLVDTAGRSRDDERALPELCSFRNALGSRARVCLVLPATMKERDLRRDIDRYRPLEPDVMVLTKVDESCDFGNIANLLLDDSCPPLSWITTGQRVPDDLCVADPEDLASRILGVPA